MLTFDENHLPEIAHMRKKPLTQNSADIAGQLAQLAELMTTYIDEAIQLEVDCRWYDDADPLYGGPPSKDKLLAKAQRLRTAYMGMALVTGIDPCEQLPATKKRLPRERVALLTRS
jgi:hypothetical protein